MQAKLIEFFERQEWPDAKLNVLLPAASVARDCSLDACGDASTTALRLPVHRILLSRSEVFKAQLLRWGKKRSLDGPAIDFTVADKEHLTGLLAALAVLYGNEQLFREVPQQDLVAAVVYGDQLAIPRAVELGMQLLQEAAGLTLDCCRALAMVPSWPHCMLPLVPAVAGQCNPDSAAEQQQQQVVQGALVAALGDLEAVWGDQQLQEQLLALPLPAAELLLSSDHLQVAGEDTVLYTVQRYMKHLDSIQGRDAAKEALVKCIRCVQLTHYSLLGMCTAADSPLFTPEQQQLLLGLLSLCQVSTEHCLVEMKGSKRIHQIPQAWLLPPRARLVPPTPVSLMWRVAIEDIRKVCRQAASSRAGRAYLEGSGITGPLHGTAFALQLHAKRNAQPPPAPDGIDIGLFLELQQYHGAYMSAAFTVAVAGQGIVNTLRSVRSRLSGWRSFFGVRPMGGDGWDEAA